LKTVSNDPPASVAGACSPAARSAAATHSSAPSPATEARAKASVIACKTGGRSARRPSDERPRSILPTSASIFAALARIAFASGGGNARERFNRIGPRTLTSTWKSLA
jgi:hypothetical protein